MKTICAIIFVLPPLHGKWKRGRRGIYRILLGAGLGLLLPDPGRAATQFWNGQAPLVGRYDGSGNWFTNSAGATTNWWNGTNDNAGNWSGSAPDAAVVGAGTGTAGIYTINLDHAASALSITFTNPGSYTLTGTNALTLTLNAPGTNVLVSDGVMAAIAVPINQNGYTMLVGDNSGLTLAGGSGSVWTGNPIFQGVNPGASVLNITRGTYNSINSTLRFDALVANITNATISGNDRLDVGRYFPGVLNLWNQGRLTMNPTNNQNPGNNINISRGQPAIINMYPGSLLSSGGNNSGPNGMLYLSHDVASQATLNIYGGIVNVGNNSNGVPGLANPLLQPINVLGGSTTYTGPDNFGIINMSGGIMTAAALEFGLGGGYTNNPTNQFNMTGGALYLGAGGISQVKNTGTNFGINLSGGIVGATASWAPACSVPMTLGTANGDVTFQTADASNTPMTIAISGPLTGPGGLRVTGPGNLVLSGANSYTGDTVVSNGRLTIITSGSPTNGAVRVDGAAGGTPGESVQVANIGQHWVINSLTYGVGSSLADFNYGSYPPSTTVAPILVSGNLDFAASPAVMVEGTAIPAGIYPLIQYGTLSGPVPASLSLPGYLSGGYLTNLAASQTIGLVVPASAYNPAVFWAVGNGFWNTTTANWLQFSNTADYADGESVEFNDIGSGTSPISVTLNQTVNPSAVTVNAATIDYIISGFGAMAGGNMMTLVKDRAGSLTVSNANTYAGGTTLNNGTLAINYGGNGSGLDSAIGTGPLTITGGALDNTSGKALTLLTPITQFWNGDFAYAGHANFNLGAGRVTLGTPNVAVTVNSNILEVDGVIGDASGTSVLTKAGGGTLTLANYNTYGGGMTLAAGTLNVNADGALGTGRFTILSGAVLDNTSGSNIVFSTGNNLAWNGSFTFLGATNLNLGGNLMSMNAVAVTVSNNDLEVDAKISGANNTITKEGAGSLTFGGDFSNGGVGLVADQGTIFFDKRGGNAFANQKMTINTNGRVVMSSPPTGNQIGGVCTVTFSGGSLDLNGDSEPITTVEFNSGLIENSTAGTTAILTSTNGVSLLGASCNFGVTNTSALTISGIISNTGGLLKTGGGTLTLVSNNTYTGSTIIAAGTVTLSAPASISGGSISNSELIEIANGAMLDVSGRGDQTFTVNPGQTLVGGGNLNGNLVTTPGSTLMPGDGMGALTVTKNITLAGATVFELNRTNAQSSDELVSVSGRITGGGVLIVTNAGPPLQVGDTFQLFPSGVTGFAMFNLPTVDANGYVYTYTWFNDIGASGSMTVASVTVSINPLPGPVLFKVGGNTLALSWPTNLGWILQDQTDSLNSGLNTNWHDVAGSGGAASANVTMSPTNPAVFFRLRHP